MNKAIVVVTVVAVAAVAGYVVMNKPKVAPSMGAQAPMSSSSEMSSVQPVTSSSSSAMSNDPSVKTIDIEAGSFYYKPNEITVTKGQQVRIVFHSVSMMHNFNIDELNVHTEMVKNGNTATFEFTADKVGTFEYYCSVGKHRQLGQVGKLIVQ